MIAYNFLERNGRPHDLPKTGVVHAQTELDKLMSKYDEYISQTEETTAKKRRRI